MSPHEPTLDGVFASDRDETRRAGWNDATRGNASWLTFFSAGLTPTSAMSAGLMELEPLLGRLALHHHKQAEIYFIVQGEGTVTVGEVQRVVKPGDAVFIPGSAPHAMVNHADTVLKVFYVFPTDRFDEIIYEFVDAPAT